MTVIDDQHGSLTWARDLARALVTLGESDVAPGHPTAPIVDVLGTGRWVSGVLRREVGPFGPFTPTVAGCSVGLHRRCREAGGHGSSWSGSGTR